MVAQKVQILIEQLGLIRSSQLHASCLLRCGRIHFVVNNLDVSMRSTSNTAALLCAVNSCRILTYEGFKASTPHNGELHIITVVCTLAEPDNTVYFG
jgi:hypothetical protein